MAEHPSSGTEDDDRDDEHAGENEAPQREGDENTETPEEFQIDDEGELPHPEDDRADEEDAEKRRLRSLAATAARLARSHADSRKAVQNCRCS